MIPRANKDKDWYAEIRKMTAGYERDRQLVAASSPSRITSLPMTGAALAYSEGAVPSRGPSKGPRPFYAKLLDVNKASRFEQGYPEPFKDTDPDLALAMSKRRRRKIDSRVYGSWSDLPPELRYHFTEKERAGLHVIADLVLQYGFCDKPVKEIADMAGVGISTVKTAMKEAKALGLIRVQSRPRKGRNHLPSIITIKSIKWLNWLQSLVAKKSATIKNSRDKQRTKRDVAPSQGAYEREKAAPQSMTEANSYAETGEMHMCPADESFRQLGDSSKPSETATVSIGRGVVSNFRP